MPRIEFVYNEIDGCTQLSKDNGSLIDSRISQITSGKIYCNVTVFSSNSEELVL